MLAKRPGFTFRYKPRAQSRLLLRLLLCPSSLLSRRNLRSSRSRHLPPAPSDLWLLHRIRHRRADRGPAAEVRKDLLDRGNFRGELLDASGGAETGERAQIELWHKPRMVAEDLSRWQM